MWPTEKCNIKDGQSKMGDTRIKTDQEPTCHVIQDYSRPYRHSSRAILNNSIDPNKIPSLKYRQVPPSSDYHKYSFFPNTVCFWNSLPATVAEAPGLAPFKRELSAQPIRAIIVKCDGSVYHIRRCWCSDADEARTRGPSVSSQALYHWATALPSWSS